MSEPTEAVISWEYWKEPDFPECKHDWSGVNSDPDHCMDCCARTEKYLLAKIRAQQAEIVREHDLYLTAHRENMKAAEMMMEMRAEIARLSALPLALEAKALRKAIEPVFGYMTACGSEGCDHGENFCTPEHSIAQSLGRALSQPSPSAPILAAVEQLEKAAEPFAKKWESMVPSITYQDSERLQDALANLQAARKGEIK